MSKPYKTALVVGGVLLCLCCLVPGSYIGYVWLRLAQQPPVDQDLAGITVTAGTLEVIVPRTREPGGGLVSPTGHWILFVSENPTRQWYIMDLQTGQERPIGIQAYGWDWLNEEEFAAGYTIFRATDLSRLELEVFDTPENDFAALEVLRGAKRIYLLPERGTGGVDIMSGDPGYPYGFDAFVAEDGRRPEGVRESDYTYRVLREKFPDTKFIVINNNPYYQPTAGVRNPGITQRDSIHITSFYVNHDFPSPDGRFYARNVREKGGSSIEIYQCGQKLVAHAVRNNWEMFPKGWAYDSSSFYFRLQPRQGWFTGDVTTSILKLNLPPEVLANAPLYEGEGFCE
jgi:hypothetical protein